MKKWVLPSAMVASLAAGVTGGMYIGPDIFLKVNPPKEKEPKDKAISEGNQEQLNKVAQAYDLISKHYIEDTNEEDLLSGAIQGMLTTLDDPYSVYMDKQTSEQFNQSLDSSFEGIGTEIGVDEGKVIIVSPYKDSPAEKAGLKPKDQIISVDEEDVTGMNVQEVSVKIRGEKGTSVNIGIKRPGVEKPLQFKIKRDRIPIETVHADLKENKIGYIEISSFSEKTSEDFKKQLKEFEKQNISGLIIDVRGNPGGLLSAVEEILVELVPADKPYLQIEKRDGEKSQYHTKLAKKKPYEMAVLINNGSASASEILAGAMKEAGGYALIGEKTFGKGTVQQAVPMDDGSNIKLTLYKWLTPDGNWIHKKGIEPTVKISQPELYRTHPLNIEQSLKQDMANEQVEFAQGMLRSLGYEPGRVDGYFDLKTEVAVKAFQKAMDMKPTGAIGEKTAAKLEEEVLKAIRDEDNDLQLNAAIRYLTR
ncbi:MAG: S41 family peptidase [Bacillus sp. (in: firmicutes)]